MEIFERVTKDATFTKTKDERKVVNFSLVMNRFLTHKRNSERPILFSRLKARQAAALEGAAAWVW